MGLVMCLKKLSFGSQLQVLFVFSSLVVCAILIIITEFHLEWLRNYLANESERVIGHSLKNQLRAFATIQGLFLINEIQSYMSFVSSNKKIAEIFHELNPDYKNNPFSETKSHLHSEALNKTFEYGVYYSRNTISEAGWKLINASSCFNYFYPLRYRTEYLGYYQGYEIDEIFWEYPGIKRRTTYTPLVREWYYKAFQMNGTLIITEPYIDFTTFMLVITISQSISGVDNKPIGVTALDVTLGQISANVLKIKVLTNGFSILVSRAGMILSVPEFWKPQGQSDVVIKIFDKTYTGLDYKDWEKIKNMTKDSAYNFTDSRGISLTLIKQEIRPYYDIQNLTHYLFICIESSELVKAKHETIESFNETYKVLFWLSISIGTSIFILISCLIYFISRKYSKKFNSIEKLFGDIVNNALFYDIVKRVDLKDFENNEKEIESLVFYCKQKLNHLESLEKQFFELTYGQTRINDAFLYKEMNEQLYPLNYYKDKKLPWLARLGALKFK